MTSNKITCAIEVANLPHHNFQDDVINFCEEHENTSYVPSEKLYIDVLKEYSGLEFIEAEILSIPDYEERKRESDLYENYEIKLCLTVKLFDTNKDSIKEKLESWISRDNFDMKYLSHEVTTSVPSFHLVHVFYLADSAIHDLFGDPIESPFIKDVWDKYMNSLITEGVCYIHGKVNQSLRDSLRKNINHLAENSEIDYHPNSNDIVRDLVHPALYSYVKGISKLKPGCQIQSKNVESKSCDYWGRNYEESKFQWLPTPFSISSDGKCTVVEYINNLNQEKFPSLYEDIERLFEIFLPYFEEVWSYIKATTFFHGEDDDPYKVLPEEEKSVVSFKGRELQVIVKIVEYVLQPGETYEGVWHAEGMSHEHIVMTGIYFLDRDIDIIGGDIRFKRSFTVNERNEVFSKVPQIRPIIINKLAEDGFVPLGNFSTEEGYLLVFPNCHIHKISKLINASEKKASSRRIVVFFVVDPEQTIISTRDISPQQQEINIEQAKTYRLELMSERKYNKDKLNVRDIELCEH